MKKYILFAFDQYYPSGGLHDMEGSFDTIEEAYEHYTSMRFVRDYYQIVDRDTWEVVQHDA